MLLLAIAPEVIEVPADEPLVELADAVSTTFEVTRDAASGLPTGKRQHEPVTESGTTCVTVWGVVVCW